MTGVTQRPYRLEVDSGAHHEPRTRYFGSLPTAVGAMRALGPRWEPYVWIFERLPGGGQVTHVKDGRAITEYAGVVMEGRE